MDKSDFSVYCAASGYDAFAKYAPINVIRGIVQDYEGSLRLSSIKRPASDTYSLRYLDITGTETDVFTGIPLGEIADNTVVTAISKHTIRYGAFRLSLGVQAIYSWLFIRPSAIRVYTPKTPLPLDDNVINAIKQITHGSARSSVIVMRVLYPISAGSSYTIGSAVGSPAEFPVSKIEELKTYVPDAHEYSTSYIVVIRFGSGAYTLVSCYNSVVRVPRLYLPLISKPEPFTLDTSDLIPQQTIRQESYAKLRMVRIINPRPGHQFSNSDLQKLNESRQRNFTLSGDGKSVVSPTSKSIRETAALIKSELDYLKFHLLYGFSVSATLSTAPDRDITAVVKVTLSNDDYENIIKLENPSRPILELALETMAEIIPKNHTIVPLSNIEIVYRGSETHLMVTEKCPEESTLYRFEGLSENFSRWAPIAYFYVVLLPSTTLNMQFKFGKDISSRWLSASEYAKKNTIPGHKFSVFKVDNTTTYDKRWNIKDSDIKTLETAVDPSNPSAGLYALCSFPPQYDDTGRMNFSSDPDFNGHRLPTILQFWNVSVDNLVEEITVDSTSPLLLDASKYFDAFDGACSWTHSTLPKEEFTQYNGQRSLMVWPADESYAGLFYFKNGTNTIIFSVIYSGVSVIDGSRFDSRQNKFGIVRWHTLPTMTHRRAIKNMPKRITMFGISSCGKIDHLKLSTLGKSDLVDRTELVDKLLASEDFSAILSEDDIRKSSAYDLLHFVIDHNDDYYGGDKGLLNAASVILNRLLVNGESNIELAKKLRFADILRDPVSLRAFTGNNIGAWKDFCHVPRFVVENSSTYISECGSRDEIRMATNLQRRLPTASGGTSHLVNPYSASGLSYPQSSPVWLCCMQPMGSPGCWIGMHTDDPNNIVQPSDFFYYNYPRRGTSHISNKFSNDVGYQELVQAFNKIGEPDGLLRFWTLEAQYNLSACVRMQIPLQLEGISDKTLTTTVERAYTDVDYRTLLEQRKVTGRRRTWIYDQTLNLKENYNSGRAFDVSTMITPFSVKQIERVSKIVTMAVTSSSVTSTLPTPLPTPAPAPAAAKKSPVAPRPVLKPMVDTIKILFSDKVKTGATLLGKDVDTYLSDETGYDREQWIRTLQTIEIIMATYPTVTEIPVLNDILDHYSSLITFTPEQTALKPIPEDKIIIFNYLDMYLDVTNLRASVAEAVTAFTEAAPPSTSLLEKWKSELSKVTSIAEFVTFVKDASNFGTDKNRLLDSIDAYYWAILSNDDTKNIELVIGGYLKKYAAQIDKIFRNIKLLRELSIAPDDASVTELSNQIKKFTADDIVEKAKLGQHFNGLGTAKVTLVRNTKTIPDEVIDLIRYLFQLKTTYPALFTTIVAQNLELFHAAYSTGYNSLDAALESMRNSIKPTTPHNFGKQLRDPLGDIKNVNTYGAKTKDVSSLSDGISKSIKTLIKSIQQSVKSYAKEVAQRVTDINFIAADIASGITRSAFEITARNSEELAKLYSDNVTSKIRGKPKRLIDYVPLPSSISNVVEPILPKMIDPSETSVKEVSGLIIGAHFKNVDTSLSMVGELIGIFKTDKIEVSDAKLFKLSPTIPTPNEEIKIITVTATDIVKTSSGLVNVFDATLKYFIPRIKLLDARTEKIFNELFAALRDVPDFDVKQLQRPFSDILARAKTFVDYSASELKNRDAMVTELFKFLDDNSTMLPSAVKSFKQIVDEIVSKVYNAYIGTRPAAYKLTEDDTIVIGKYLNIMDAALNYSKNMTTLTEYLQQQTTGLKTQIVELNDIAANATTSEAVLKVAETINTAIGTALQQCLATKKVISEKYETNLVSVAAANAIIMARRLISAKTIGEFASVSRQYGHDITSGATSRHITGKSLNDTIELLSALNIIKNSPKSIAADAAISAFGTYFDVSDPDILEATLLNSSEKPTAYIDILVGSGSTWVGTGKTSEVDGFVNIMKQSFTKVSDAINKDVSNKVNEIYQRLIDLSRVAITEIVTNNIAVARPETDFGKTYSDFLNTPDVQELRKFTTDTELGKVSFPASMYLSDETTRVKSLAVPSTLVIDASDFITQEKKRLFDAQFQEYAAVKAKNALVPYPVKIQMSVSGTDAPVSITIPIAFGVHTQFMVKHTTWAINCLAAIKDAFVKVIWPEATKLIASAVAGRKTISKYAEAAIMLPQIIANIDPSAAISTPSVTTKDTIDVEKAFKELTSAYEYVFATLKNPQHVEPVRTGIATAIFPGDPDSQLKDRRKIWSAISTSVALCSQVIKMLCPDCTLEQIYGKTFSGDIKAAAVKGISESYYPSRPSTIPKVDVSTATAYAESVAQTSMSMRDSLHCKILGVDRFTDEDAQDFYKTILEEPNLTKRTDAYCKLLSEREIGPFFVSFEKSGTDKFSKTAYTPSGIFQPESLKALNEGYQGIAKELSSRVKFKVDTLLDAKSLVEVIVTGKPDKDQTKSISPWPTMLGELLNKYPTLTKRYFSGTMHRFSLSETQSGLNCGKIASRNFLAYDAGTHNNLFPELSNTNYEKLVLRGLLCKRNGTDGTPEYLATWVCDAVMLFIEEFVYEAYAAAGKPKTSTATLAEVCQVANMYPDSYIKFTYEKDTSKMAFTKSTISTMMALGVKYLSYMNISVLVDAFEEMHARFETENQLPNDSRTKHEHRGFLDIISNRSVGKTADTTLTASKTDLDYVSSYVRQFVSMYSAAQPSLRGNSYIWWLPFVLRAYVYRSSNNSVSSDTVVKFGDEFDRLLDEHLPGDKTLEEHRKALEKDITQDTMKHDPILFVIRVVCFPKSGATEPSGILNNEAFNDGTTSSRAMASAIKVHCLSKKSPISMMSIGETIVKQSQTTFRQLDCLKHLLFGGGRTRFMVTTSGITTTGGHNYTVVALGDGKGYVSLNALGLGSRAENITSTGSTSETRETIKYEYAKSDPSKPDKHVRDPDKFIEDLNVSSTRYQFALEDTVPAAKTLLYLMQFLVANVDMAILDFNTYATTPRLGSYVVTVDDATGQGAKRKWSAQLPEPIDAVPIVNSYTYASKLFGGLCALREADEKLENTVSDVPLLITPITSLKEYPLILTYKSANGLLNEGMYHFLATSVFNSTTISSKLRNVEYDTVTQVWTKVLPPGDFVNSDTKTHFKEVEAMALVIPLQQKQQGPPPGATKTQPSPDSEKLDATLVPYYLPNHGSDEPTRRLYGGLLRMLDISRCLELNALPWFSESQNDKDMSQWIDYVARKGSTTEFTTKNLETALDVFSNGITNSLPTYLDIYLYAYYVECDYALYEPASYSLRNSFGPITGTFDPTNLRIKLADMYKATRTQSLTATRKKITEDFVIAFDKLLRTQLITASSAASVILSEPVISLVDKSATTTNFPKIISDIIQKSSVDVKEHIHVVNAHCFAGYWQMLVRTNSELSDLNISDAMRLAVIGLKNPESVYQSFTHLDISDYLTKLLIPPRASMKNMDAFFTAVMLPLARLYSKDFSKYPKSPTNTPSVLEKLRTDYVTSGISTIFYGRRLNTGNILLLARTLKTMSFIDDGTDVEPIETAKLVSFRTSYNMAVGYAMSDAGSTKVSVTPTDWQVHSK